MSETKQAFVARVLVDYNNQSTPAFFDGDQVITPTMKYKPTRVHEGEPWRLVAEQKLSVAGFERNIENCCTGELEWMTGFDFFQFNRTADYVRKTYQSRILKGREDKDRIAEELRQRSIIEQKRYAEHRAVIDALVAAAKFKRQAVVLFVSADVDLTHPRTVKLMDGAARSYVYKGLAVHRNADGYQITHIASGKRCSADYDNLNEAKIAAVRLTTYTDWTADENTVVAAMKGFPHSVLARDVYAVIDFETKKPSLTIQLKGGK